MPFENAIFGVRNGISDIADLIKPCNQSDNSFIKNKPEPWLFSEQRVWRGYRNLHPIPNPKAFSKRLLLKLWTSAGISNLCTLLYYRFRKEKPSCADSR